MPRAYSVCLEPILCASSPFSVPRAFHLHPDLIFRASRLPPPPRVYSLCLETIIYASSPAFGASTLLSVSQPWLQPYSLISSLLECFRTNFMSQISHQSVAPPGPSAPRQECTSGHVSASPSRAPLYPSPAKVKFSNALFFVRVYTLCHYPVL